MKEATERLQVRIKLPLDSVDLDVAFDTSSQATGVFGVSGAGKTNMLSSIAGLERRARGYIRLGEAVWLDSSRRFFLRPEHRFVGYVPQDGLLFPHKNVRGNLLAGTHRAPGGRNGQQSTFQSVCKVLELEPFLERDIATLSGGEKQRVALGRALCSAPRLLLLDEPLASLDVALRGKVLPFLRRVREEFDIPLILVSHEPAEVRALCDDMIVLEQGRIVARGQPREVLTQRHVVSLIEREKGWGGPWEQE